MTEKRFVYIEHKGADYILDSPNWDLDYIEMLGDTLEAEEIVDLLNQLNDENEQLRKEKIYAETKLYKANEELLMRMDYDLIVKNNTELEKENGQLKQRIKQLEDLIDEVWQKYEDAHGMSIDNTDWF